MNQRELIILDFDRTLLDPSELSGHFLKLLHERGLLSKPGHDRIRSDLNDPNRTLDLAKELSDQKVDLSAAMKLAHQVFVPNQFLYPDVAPFLERFREHQIIIMTSGSQEWQAAKLTLCTALEPYPQIILANNKGDHLAEHLAIKADGLSLAELGGERFARLHLIDDRTDNLVPLIDYPKTKLWHLLRPGAKYGHNRVYSGIHQITTLAEIASL
jgi:hypothetical protein